GERLDQSDRDLVDGCVHEIGRVVDDASFQALRQLGLNFRKYSPHALDHGQKVRGGRYLDADEYPGVAVEQDPRLVAVGPQSDLGHVAQVHIDAVDRFDHQIAK